MDDVLSAEAARRGCALRCVDPARDGWALDPDAIRLGMRSATLPGRFERRVLAGRTAVLGGAYDPMQLPALMAPCTRSTPGLDSRGPSVQAAPMIAVRRAVGTEAAVPVVLSGSFHLLAAVHGATVPP